MDKDSVLETFGPVGILAIWACREVLGGLRKADQDIQKDVGKVLEALQRIEAQLNAQRNNTTT